MSDRRWTGGRGWGRMVLASALVAGAGLGGLIAPVRAAETCATVGSQVTCTFTYAGGEQTFAVPAGVSSITVQATGAHGGASFSSKPGGRGDVVTGTVAVAPNSTLYVYVGGAGGYNGGGNGGTFGGGSGGGASDVRTTAAATSGSLSTRLVVAGGGGGGGDAPLGGGGGDAGSAGASGTNSLGQGGGGGGAGTAVAGGAGGSAGSQGGFAGNAGSPGSPGSGGAGAGGSVSGAGGGGGGLYGGGGGGSSGSFDAQGGGGGGGGGSDLVPAGGSSALADAAVTNGLVVITYDVPTQGGGPGTATPEAPSSVLFGAGAALLLLGFGVRARRRTRQPR